MLNACITSRHYVDRICNNIVRTQALDAADALSIINDVIDDTNYFEYQTFYRKISLQISNDCMSSQKIEGREGFEENLIRFDSIN